MTPKNCSWLSSNSSTSSLDSSTYSSPQVSRGGEGRVGEGRGGEGNLYGKNQYPPTGSPKNTVFEKSSRRMQLGHISSPIFVLPGANLLKLHVWSCV